MTFLQANTTGGAIVTDEETSLMLRYAIMRLAPLNSDYRNGMTTAKLGDLRLGWRRWTLDDPSALDADVVELRQRWSLSLTILSGSSTAASISNWRRSSANDQDPAGSATSGALTTR